MLNIPESIKTLYKTDGTRKNLRVHFPNGEMSDITNSSIVKETLKFTESVCSQNVFRFGLAEASVIQFETVGVGNMFGMTIECAIEIDTSALSAAEIAAIQAGTWDGTLVLLSDSDIGFGYFRIRLGTFIVDSCPRNHDTMTHRQVTAYSRAFSSTRFNLPSQSVWPTIYARDTALMALAFNNGLIDVDHPAANRDTNYTAATLWAKVGTSQDIREYHCYFAGDRGTQGTAYIGLISREQVNYSPSFSPYSPSLVSIDLPGYDAAAYEASGMSIVNSISSVYDLTHDSTGNKIYSSNEEALRDRCPWMFYPCLITDVYDTKKDIGLFGLVSRVIPGEMMPIISHRVTERTGFYITDERYFVQSVKLYCILNHEDSVRNMFIMSGNGIGTIIKDIPLQNGFLYEHPVVTTYGLSSSSMFEIRMQNSSSTSKRFVSVDDGGNMQNVGRTIYFFNAAIDHSKLLDGMLEFDGLFGREKRTSGWESFALTNASPVALTPGDYNSVWWDEYNVSPIGTVVVKFLNNSGGMETANIVIGSGSSVYDMTDNSALEVIADASLSNVQTMLNTAFLPRSQYAAFTPIELDMPGWPWLQAGDALAVTAQDGTTVNSYALRIEMSGIQNLSSNITANAGEIMEV